MIDMEGLREALAALLGTPVDELVRLPGGASRETWSFRVGGAKLILRRDPPRSVQARGRSIEFELLRRTHRAGVPVPKVVEFAEDLAGAPGFVMEFVEGETIARRILRDDEYTHARARMAAQCGEILARIHAVDVTGIPGLAPPQGNAALTQVDRYRRTLDAFGEPHPAMEIALRWLQRNPPEAKRLGLVHGDFRNGNLIVGSDGVCAVIDWEMPHIGDPWEDLGWLCVRSWRFGAPGEVGGFGSRDDLYKGYETESGIPVDADAVRWWEVFGNLKWGVATMSQTFTHLRGRVKSVELAAIGRRTVEAEYDLLRLIRGN